MTKFDLTAHGAFKTKQRKPGENTPEGAMPDIFKFERIPGEHALVEPVIKIYNETKTWEAEFKISEAPKELIQVMADRSKIYMICIPAPQGLQPMTMISDQNW